MQRASDLPSIELLTPNTQKQITFDKKELDELACLVETKLHDFGVEAKVMDCHPGPVITRFDLELAAGLKVSRISSLDKDLARSLSVSKVRVVEVIPGKPFVGLELPNKNRQIVTLREIIESKQYAQASSPLTLALGKDIAGNPTVTDLAKMPHLLVAGTTGSGKSVGVNSMLLSMLYKARPNELKLILIDPKMLELSIYDDIPHLLTPVVTDMKDAANALRWCIGEMEQRYRLMSKLGVRNILGFNNKVQSQEIADPLHLSKNAPFLQPLPYIVVIVDEFADMIMVVGKKVEELIARLAQKARAAGIHLMLATQRPSVDVITGLIKANIPSRIGFQVSSKIDSRTILDQSGAEQLLGYGDMLYLPPGGGIPTRIHGAFVSDEEVHAVVSSIKAQGEPEYIDLIVEEEIGTNEAKNAMDSENIYDKAVYIVTSSRKASISYLQRRLGVGYNKAATLIEEMEKQGIVSMPQGNRGDRIVLASEPI